MKGMRDSWRLHAACMANQLELELELEIMVGVSITHRHTHTHINIHTHCRGVCPSRVWPVMLFECSVRYECGAHIEKIPPKRSLIEEPSIKIPSRKTL